jgi:acyl-ACP thioesterase
LRSVWNEEILIKSYEVDYNKETKLNSIFNYMQEAAFNHANNLGAGYEDLTNKGYIWVLSRVKIKVIRYPEWGEKIALETWPKGMNKLFALRDFIFRDENNEEIVLATTAWLVLDYKNMRPQKVQGLPFNLPDNNGRYAIDEELGKLECCDTFEFETERTAAYSDIDVNNHVNNAKYVEWVQDCFSDEFYSDKHVKTLQLNFISQTKLGNKIILKRGIYKGNSNTIYIEGINEASSTRTFQSLIELE